MLNGPGCEYRGDMRSFMSSICVAARLSESMTLVRKVKSSTLARNAALLLPSETFAAAARIACRSLEKSNPAVRLIFLLLWWRWPKRPRWHRRRGFFFLGEHPRGNIETAADGTNARPDNFRPGLSRKCEHCWPPLAQFPTSGE